MDRKVSEYTWTAHPSKVYVWETPYGMGMSNLCAEKELLTTFNFITLTTQACVLACFFVVVHRVQCKNCAGKTGNIRNQQIM